MRIRRVVFIVLFFVSIAGLAIVQYRYLRIGLNLAGVQFSRKVGTASQDIRNELSGRNQLTYLLGSALERDSTRFNTGLDHITDASRHFLDDYLREKLFDNEIDADFSFSLMTRDSSYYLGSPRRLNEDREPYTYPIEIHGYLPERIGQRLVLQLQFANLNRYFLTQLNGLTLPSLLFLLGIFIAVLWGLRTYYWQERTITTTHEFINNLTHELRTPVFSISLAAKILKEKAGQVTEREKPGEAGLASEAGRTGNPEESAGALSEACQALADAILQQTSRLSTHIDKVLELGSLEKGATAMPMKEMDFLPLLQRVCQEFDSRCQLEAIPFSCDLPKAPLWLMGSAFHLENAVNNLLDNARKYGERQPISLRVRISGEMLLLEVEDRGQGIPAKSLKKIFRKYYRIPDGDRQGVRGYGLGLSYVKTIVQKHRGRISAISRPGEGTVISLHLPLITHAAKTV